MFLDNARALAEGLISRGFNLLSGGTDSHMMVSRLLEELNLLERLLRRLLR